MFSGLVIGGTVLPFAYAFFKLVMGDTPDRALACSAWTAAGIAVVAGLLIDGAGQLLTK